MPKNTDTTPQKKRKKDAVKSAALSGLFMVASGVTLLVLRSVYLKGTFWGAVLLIMALADLLAVVPLMILLKARFKEIEGGEEDVASEY